MSDKSGSTKDHSSYLDPCLRVRLRFPDGACAVSLHCSFAGGGQHLRVTFGREPGKRAPRAIDLACLYNPNFMDLGLKGRVAIVAASSQGIGRATAEGFAAEGCRIAMCARNRAALDQAADKIRGQHHTEIFAEALDVTDADAVHRFVAEVATKFGKVDICVTNAGGPPAKGFLAATIEDWRRALEANFLSTVYFAREVIPHMQQKHW